MSDLRLENLHVTAEEPISTPMALKREYPLTEKAVRTVLEGRNTIKAILDGEDKRRFVVVGPCSIHDVSAAKDYAEKLAKLKEELDDKLYLVMRVYFEKPRTRTGWQGLINDPYLDQSCKIEDGLKLARQCLLDIAELGVPAAGEALDLVTPQYVQDLIAWTAIGARTTESQSHRKMASGFSCAVGFKNGTNGNVDVAVNAIHSANAASNFLSVAPNGQVAVIRTTGNPYTHVVLRGGDDGPNYQKQSIEACEQALLAAGVEPNIMVDCSHANSNKEPMRQVQVLEDIGEQIKAGNTSIKGIMIESNLHAGNQPIPTDGTPLYFGVSVTDACIDWETTEAALRHFANQLSTR